ncbi:MAG: O-antigen ligase family protein [Geminicoccaceae bacterium]|nr:O-antigen ligase family protein [Geminicoccaceae bacterium]
MRWLTLLFYLLAVFLINAHSVRTGEEERRIWAPIVLALLTLVLLARVPLLLRTNWRVLVSPPVLLYALYLLWLGVTQFWSVAPAEGRSHILVLWITLLAVLALSDERPYRTAVALMGAMSVVMLWSWAGAAVGASWVKGTEAAWRLKGVMMHQQTLTLVTAAGMLVGMVWAFNRARAGLDPYRARVWAFMACSLVTMLATKGRSLSAFFVIAAFAAWFFAAKGAKRLWVLMGGIFIGGGLYVAVDILLPLISKGNEESLSGRTIVWELTWNEIVKRPFGGFGFGTYQDYFYALWNNWAPGHAHNLWLQVAFESGGIGVALITLFLVAVVAQGVRFQRQTGLVSYGLVLTVYLLLGGLTSVFFGEKLSTLYGLFLLFVVQEERLRVEALARCRGGRRTAAPADLALATAPA